MGAHSLRSVRIDVDQLLRDREEERANANMATKSGLSQEANVENPKKKRKPEGVAGGPKLKKIRTSSNLKAAKITVTLKLGPKPAAPEPFPCCLCVNMSEEGLLRVHDPPTGRRDIAVDELPGSSRGPKEWMAHEDCANVIPETWVDHIEISDPRGDGTRTKEKVVFGVDGIVKDRWNLARIIPDTWFHIGTDLCFRNALPARGVVTRLMGLPFNAPKANARRPSTLHVLEMDTSKGSFTRCCKRWRRKLFFSTRMLGISHPSRCFLTQISSRWIPLGREMLSNRPRWQWISICLHLLSIPQWPPPARMVIVSLKSSRRWRCKFCARNTTQFVKIHSFLGFELMILQW